MNGSVRRLNDFGGTVVVFPVLTEADRPIYPADHRCPMCGGSFELGAAYLSAGALHLSDDGRDSLHCDRLQAFLHVGFHGSATDMSDSCDVSVVADLHGGQFDLQWCSVARKRQWLLGLLREVESLAGIEARPALPSDAEPGDAPDPARDSK